MEQHGLFSRLRRRGRGRTLSPGRWEAVASRCLWQWRMLDDGERARLAQRGLGLLDKRWEAARGFAIDERMRITIAAHGALLALGREEDLFSNVTAVVVHPTTMVLRGQRRGPSPGVVTNAPLAAHGHTSWRGPVFIAWNAVERSLRSPQRGSNVILHEFAHKIDALNGLLDGTPPLTDHAQQQRWVEVCSAELEALRRGDGIPVLRSYAGTNPSEFFAVATEAFFVQPLELRAAAPSLYDVLQSFYRQDTAARQLRAGPDPDEEA